MNYVIDGAYRSKVKFGCVNGHPATILAFHTGFSPVTEIGAKVILKGLIPDSCTPTMLKMYTIAPDGMNWALLLLMPRYFFDQHFEKMPLAVPIHPMLAMKIETADRIHSGQALSH